MRRDLVYILVILLLGVLSFYLYQKSRNAEELADNRESVIAEKNDSISYWVNKAGNMVAEKRAAEVKLSEAETYYSEELERISKDHGVKPSNVQSFSISEFESSGGGTVPLRPVFDDSFNLIAGEKMPMEFNIDDGFLSFDGIVSDSLSYKYKYQDEISISLSKKKKPFGKEYLFFTGTLKNPNGKIVNSTNVLIQTRKDKRFSIGPSITYNPFENRVFPGISLSYSVIKF